MAISWVWRVHVGFVGKGDEFNKATPARMCPARPADEPPTPPAVEGAEAGSCDPAPGEGGDPTLGGRLLSEAAAAAAPRRKLKLP